MKTSTSKFGVKRLFYDDGTFAMASGIWDGGPDERVGMRWYSDKGIGYPQTYGKPQWFIVPAAIGNIILGIFSVGSVLKNVVKTSEKESRED